MLRMFTDDPVRDAERYEEELEERKRLNDLEELERRMESE